MTATSEAALLTWLNGGGTAWRSGGIGVHDSFVEVEGAALRHRLSAWDGAAGWVCTTERVVFLPTGGPLPDGHILSADLVLGEHTLVLRRSGSAVQGVVLRAIPDAPGFIQARRIVAQDRRHRLVYDVAWSDPTASEVGPSRPTLARLAAIESWSS